MPPWLLLGGGGVLAFVAYHFSGASSPDKAVSTVSTAQQATNRGIILAIFASQGFHPNVGRAAWINAMAESNGDNRAIGDNGHAVGVFQISDLNGRRDLGEVDRMSVESSCAWLFSAEAAALAKVDALARSGASLGSVAATFCALVERPRDIAGESARRGAAAKKLFPEVA